MPRASAILFFAAFIVTGPGLSAQDTARRERFETKIRPLLARHCIDCHGPEDQEGGLRLDHGDFLRRGGDRGPVVDRERPERSLLLQAIDYEDPDLRMPPDGRLEDQERAVLRAWVRDGAAWPDEARPDEGPKEVFDLSARRARHWAWRPIENPPLPETKLDDWARDAIDAFILARQEAAGVGPGPDAEAATWLRRVHFALTGLPPRPAMVDDFLADPSPAARARVVDALLGTEDYGEHWARGWLDLVRYAESYGHEFDYDVPHAYRYRDYVIRALNADVPYDDFLREHLAGDLLDEPRRNPEDGTNESIIATGFWHFGQATHGPVDVRQDEADRVANQIDVATKTFLGLTVACARCHDHKFDAITATDYYALAGYLRSSRRVEEHLDPGGHIAEASGRSFIARTASSRGLSRLELPRDLEAGLAAAARLEGRLPREAAFEAETLAGQVNAGRWRRQRLGGRFSEGHHQWWSGAAVGDELVLKATLPAPGDYVVEAKMTRARDYGVVQWFHGESALGAPQDLYAEAVTPTGPVVLGSLRTTGREIELRVRIEGENEAAIPGFMFGLDTLHFRPVAESLRDHPAMREEIAKTGLSADRLEAWLAAHEDRIAPPSASAREADPARTASPAARRIVFEASDRRIVASRDISGAAFPPNPVEPGEMALDPTVGLVPGTRSSRAPGRKFEGELRTPGFLIPKDGLSYRIAGESARVRVIIDGYVMDRFNALLFNGVSFTVNTGGRWTWIHQRGDLQRYAGHRAHIEFVDEGEGWIAIDRVIAGPPPETGRPGPVAAGLSVAHIRERWAAGDRSAVAALLVRHGLLEFSAGIRKEIAETRKVVARLPRPRRVLATRDGEGTDEWLFIRGNPKTLGERVPRRPLLAFDGERVSAPKAGSGRLALAENLLHPDRPFTARVAVNRTWHHLFGRGLVSTPDDLGELGTAPSHPELLDHLAHWFRTEGGWSRKRLIRRIVLSRTWGLESRARDERTEALDPSNLLLHRAPLRRLTGEALRDAMLAVSGRTDPRRFGPSVPVHLTPFMSGRGRPRGGPVDGEGRRSVYLSVRRNFLSPFFLAFDAPNPATTAGRRSVSNVPAQALALMNSELAHELAGVWAERITRARKTTDERIDAMYREAFARPPSPRERAAARAFFDGSDESDGERLADFAQVLFNVKTFSWIP